VTSGLSLAHETLLSNRAEALNLANGKGLRDTKVLLEEAARDLKKRISQRVRPGKDDTFTLAQLKTTLAQVEDVTRGLVQGIQTNLLDTGDVAANLAASDTIDYLRTADKAFRGVGVQPLALKEVTMLDAATQGVRSSILSRLASSGEPIEGADEEPHPAKMGILQRYGVETIGNFERVLQRGLITRKSWSAMEAEITEQSPFLQGQPAWWATRIVRTEAMSAYNAAGWESIREADDQLEDMVKFLAATFDDRTGADSYAVHGQCRRPEQAFQSWYGFYQHPPNRPNDREIVVPHRISWKIPPYLAARSDEEVARVWKLEGNKKGVPPRPPITTVEFSLFGKEPEKKLPAKTPELEESPEDIDAH
jgi:hypothetical protein